MSDEYKTRQEFEEENEDYEEAISKILDEVQSPNPDLNFIEETAAEALGIDIDSEDGEEGDDVEIVA